MLGNVSETRVQEYNTKTDSAACLRRAGDNCFDSSALLEAAAAFTRSCLPAVRSPSAAGSTPAISCCCFSSCCVVTDSPPPRRSAAAPSPRHPAVPATMGWVGSVVESRQRSLLRDPGANQPPQAPGERARPGLAVPPLRLHHRVLVEGAARDRGVCCRPHLDRSCGEMQSQSRGSIDWALRQTRAFVFFCGDSHVFLLAWVRPEGREGAGGVVVCSTVTVFSLTLFRDTG